jgi:hypothetical protein
MQIIPYWKGLVVAYFLLVAIPVYYVHSILKQRAYANRSFSNLLLYFIGVLASAFVMHSVCMWLYFTFFFGVRD